MVEISAGLALDSAHLGISSHVHVRYMSSPVRLSVTLVHPTLAIKIIRIFPTSFGTLAIC